MKKNIALSISIIALFIIILYFQVIVPKENKLLAGTQVNDYLYTYNINPENKEINDFIIIGDEIYYLLSEDINDKYTYEIFKRNIYNPKEEKLGTLKNTNSYCRLKTEYIECINENTTKIYNFEFKEIYQTTINEAEQSTFIVPYKDTFIKVIGNILYITQNKEDKQFRQIDEMFKDFFAEEYFYTSQNTFIIFYDYEHEKYYLYDINNNNYEIIEYSFYQKYNQGIYFYNHDKFIIYNLNNNTQETYTNYLQEDFYYSNILDEEGNIFYGYNSINHVLYIINLKQETIKIFNLEIDIEDTLNEIQINQNYLYLESSNNFYLIDLTTLNLEERKIADYLKEKENNINELITNIKSNYNVNIKIKEDAITTFPDFNAQVENKTSTINESLIKIETILKKYNKEFFDNFYDSSYNGLNIYLTGTLTPSDYETQISNPAAYSLTYNNEYMIVVDINQSNIEELICHEIMHNLEFQINNKNTYAFAQWEQYNPQDFYYNYSYTQDYVFDYTIDETNKENAYFIDNYSHTYPLEDRARIFESICACNETSIIKDYPNLYSKGEYLKEEILNYYPSLKNASLFNSIN